MPAHSSSKTSHLILMFEDHLPEILFSKGDSKQISSLEWNVKIHCTGRKAIKQSFRNIYFKNISKYFILESKDFFKMSCTMTDEQNLYCTYL